MAVIDASVYIAVVNRSDHHHAAARAWHHGTAQGGEPLFAPWILVAEVSAALSRGLGDAAFAHQTVHQIADDGMVQLIPVDAALAVRAAAIAADHRIRGCDAVYVALAAELGETLVTFDRQQSARAAAAVPVHRPGGAGSG